jgi:hypothetical protein
MKERKQREDCEGGMEKEVCDFNCFEWKIIILIC